MKALFRKGIKHVATIAFLLSFYSSYSYQVSPESRFSILTCSPGPDLYSIFGHTAIRFEDTYEGKILDIVYNYGTFDFKTENFYLKFARGKLPYLLSRSSFGSFQQEYLYYGRGIEEQELILTVEEKQKLFDLLEENYKPENRTYHYDFFYDNCSTRVRDIIENSLNAEAKFTYVYKRKYTFRQAIQSYLDYQPWSDFGIDLALGLPCDREIEYAQFMFLPDSLMKEFNYGMKGDQPIVHSSSELLPREYELQITSKLTPLVVFSLFLLLHGAFSLWRIRKKKIYFSITDRLLFFVTGLAGLMVLLLWFATDHNATKWNLNILWANPVLLWLTFVRGREWTGWKRVFLNIYLGILFLLLFTWFFLPQKMHIAVIPIVVALIFSLLKILRPGMFIKKAN